MHLSVLLSGSLLERVGLSLISIPNHCFNSFKDVSACEVIFIQQEAEKPFKLLGLVFDEVFVPEEVDRVLAFSDTIFD